MILMENGRGRYETWLIGKQTQEAKKISKNMKSDFTSKTKASLVYWNPWESQGIEIQFPRIPMFG